MENFSFDEWAALYKSDPAEFERRREKLIEDEIAKASESNQNALYAIQIQVDAIRAVHTPLNSTILISRMMTERLEELVVPLISLRNSCEDWKNELEKKYSNDNADSSNRPQ